MKTFCHVSLLALCASGTALGVLHHQKPTLPDSLIKASQDPDLVRRRKLFLQVHVMRPYPVHFQMLPLDPVSAAGQKADLRPTIAKYGISIKNQGDRGTCSVFALNFLHEFAAARANGRKNLNFSEEYLNYIGNLATGQWVDGGFFSDLNNGYQAFGHVPQREMPYTDPIKSQAQLDAEALPVLPQAVLVKKFKATFIKAWDNTTGPTTAELNRACDMLDKGVPVASGFRWPDNGHFVQKTVGGVDMMVYIPPADVFDGHSIDLVGYRRGAQFEGGGYFIFRNSWGSGWGDHGYGYMSFKYVKNYANDMVCYP